MITNEHDFWLTALVCTVFLLLAEAMLGYVKQLWYWKAGLPLPFSRREISLAFGLSRLSSRRFYVARLSNSSVALRYRFLGNFDPSFVKVFLVAKDDDKMRAYATLNWWPLALLAFAFFGALRFDHFTYFTFLVLLSLALVAGQLKALEDFLR